MLGTNFCEKNQFRDTFLFSERIRMPEIWIPAKITKIVIRTPRRAYDYHIICFPKIQALCFSASSLLQYFYKEIGEKFNEN